MWTTRKRFLSCCRQCCGTGTGAGTGTGTVSFWPSKNRKHILALAPVPVPVIKCSKTCLKHQFRISGAHSSWIQGCGTGNLKTVRFRHFIWIRFRLRFRLRFRFQLRFRVIYIQIHLRILLHICVHIRKRICIQILKHILMQYIYICTVYTYVQIPILRTVHACTYTCLAPWKGRVCGPCEWRRHFEKERGGGSPIAGIGSVS